MHPLGWLARYFFAAVVGAATVVKVIDIVKLEVGDAVKGIAFRNRVHDNKHRRDDT
jgi:hypothetical protein